MDYAEFAPAADLSPFVRCVWTYHAKGPGAAPERIVPDGRCELIVHLGEPYAELDARGRERAQPNALFCGQVTRPLHLRARGEASVLGVRFHAWGARAFLGRSLREATDMRLPLDQLWVGAGSGLVRDLLALRGLPARIQALQSFVRMHVAAHDAPRDSLVESCVARIESDPAGFEVATVAVDAGLGRRQLERRFADAVGVGPALFASILRFRRVFDVLERDAAAPWTEAALAAGYFDQSHFIREFRRFVGCTPTEFVASARGLSEALAQRQGDVANVQAASAPAR